MLDVARGLAQRGMAVDLVLVAAQGPYLELLPGGVRLINLDRRRVLTAIPGLVRYLRRERPAALLATMPETNAAALLAARLAGCNTPVVARRANTLSMEYAAERFKARLILKLEKRLLPRATAIVANSQGAAKDLQRHIPKIAGRVQVVYNPVVWPDVAEQAAQPVEHPWFYNRGFSNPGVCDPDIPVVLSVGRLTVQKGHSTLLRAFAETLQSRRARLVVLGEGPERPNLLRLAQELGISGAVDFPGFRVNPFAYMARARLFALSSIYEGFPNVLVQAMACGTPVVSTDCPSGPGEILEGGKWGRLVPVNDSHSLAKAMLDTLERPLPASSLIARAGVFSAESSIDAYQRIIAQC